MSTEISNWVEYVKSEVESDITRNFNLCGEDYTAQLGGALRMYLVVPHKNPVLTAGRGLTELSIEEKKRQAHQSLFTERHNVL